MLNGSLFTRDFLTEGIRGATAWAALGDAAITTTRARLEARFAATGQLKSPTEAETEQELIWPVLEAVGWADMLVQQSLSVKAREHVPDALLFGSADAKAKAAPLAAWQRFQHGLCVVEAKRWNRVLDREDRSGDPGVPSTQMLRYLRRVDDVTNGGLRWGVLTNGRHWRLYFQGALSVAEGFVEIDLGKVLGLPGCEPDLLDRRPPSFADDQAWREHVLKLFIVLFGRSAFVPDGRGETFHQLALREGKQWEERVAQDLSATVFDQVFPALGAALAAADGRRPADCDAAYLAELRDAALVLLYRLLFVLYAEDRGLLPDETGPYADYSLTRLRMEIAAKKERGAGFSDRMKAYWSRLDGVFGAIGAGDDALGIPPYNGGLFDPASAPLLARVQLPDAAVAELVFRLSHLLGGEGRPARYINYRDLTVQQLGSVYERILEHGFAVEDGRIDVADNDAARRDSSSYYTPEELVGLVIERAVGPLVAERLHDFSKRGAALACDPRTKDARLAELVALDPATRMLDLKICDPAMGSGHFLVSLVDWLSDRVLDAMEDAAVAIAFAPYVSPLAARIEAIRARIQAEAKAHGWPIADGQLDDRQVVRRMVLKRCVYGVDKNPMAVELAKVSLWLHSFTVGAPLSFLDHHLRQGDSVVGAWTRPTVDALKARGALFNVGAVARVEQVAGLMAAIEAKTDSDVAEVRASKEEFGVVADAIAPVAALFSLATAERMMGVFEGAPRRPPPPPERWAGASQKQVALWGMQHRAFEAASALGLAFEGAFGDPFKIAAGSLSLAPTTDELMLAPQDEADLPLPADQLDMLGTPDLRRRVLADRLVGEARRRAALHGFFHWEIGFPNLWTNLLSAEPQGGFDAVIGNPPYLRQEALGDEVKRALKGDYAAYDGMADIYVYFYEQGLKLLRPGGRLSYVVTNKWLKAGYAEPLRNLFATKAEVEFVADFGHAKHFFPAADVFPSVLVIRKPSRAAMHPGRHPEEARSAVSKDAPPSSVLRDEPPPALPDDGSPQHDAVEEAGRLQEPGPTVDVCVIPRDAVPRKGLSAAVAAATYPLPRAHFTRESWTLEPPAVMALLDKIKRNGVPLAEYAGVKPLYGIKTGFNDAFLINTKTRDQLVRDDPGCAAIIKPYLRGQDIERWWSPPSGLHMIVLKSSGDHHWPWADAPDEAEAEQRFRKAYPSLHAHMAKWESFIDPESGARRGLRHREDHGRFWWELRPCAYYTAFELPKRFYVDITWSASFMIDVAGRYANNTAYFIPSGDTWLLRTLNAPIGWWYSWRRAQHGKDEALRYFTSFVESYPVPPSDNAAAQLSKLAQHQEDVIAGKRSIHDWLRHEFGLAKPPRALAEPHRLDADGFVVAVRAALPKSRKWSAAEIARLKGEHATTLAPAATAARDILAIERELSDLVNSAYGLTPDEVQLMWRTAPPRMPLDPADELRRLGLAAST